MIDARPASGSAGLQSSADAREYLMESFRAQLEQSEEQKAPPNTSIEGDASATAAFAVLLLQEQQRAFFLQLVRDRRFWPRLRSLVGAPPYGFLLPEDEGLLNASGIAKHRSHLAPTASTMSNLGDFGCGHFRDEAQRLYRVVAKRGASDADLPGEGCSAQRVVVDVRLRPTRAASAWRSPAAAPSPSGARSSSFLGRATWCSWRWCRSCASGPTARTRAPRAWS